MRSSATAWLIGGVVLTIYAGAARAQAAPTDPANDPFARYSPGACAQAAMRGDRQYWHRHRLADTTSTLIHRPLQGEIVAAVRRCVARFTVSAVPVPDLFDLGRAYVAAEQPAQADSAFKRWLALLAPQPIPVQAWALRQIVDVYLEARPIDLARARIALAQLDALGPGAAAGRIVSYFELAGKAREMDSAAVGESAARGAIRAGPGLTADARDLVGYVVNRAYVALGDVHIRRNDPAAAAATMHQAVRDWQSLDRRISDGILEEIEQYERLGTTGAAIQAARWFGDTTALPRPALAKRSLVVFASEYYLCGAAGLPTVLRRLQERFPDLEITLMTQTVGYDDDGPRLVTLAEEFELARRCFVDEFRYPGALAVWQTEFDRRRIDHGLVPKPNPNSTYYRPNEAWGVLFDRNGKLRLEDGIGIETELRWQGVLSELP